MFVVAQASSTNTSCAALMLGWSARQAARASATSARACSAACRVFMDGPPLTTRRRLRWILGREPMTKMPIAVLGIDLGKTSCSLAGFDASGAVVLRRRMTRHGMVAFIATLPSCVVAMEACCGAHFLGRMFEAQGHTVRLMSPEYVRPYVKAQKTDDRDAEAIAEAATRPTIGLGRSHGVMPAELAGRLVTLKTETQLDLQVLHRARQRLECFHGE
jgi:hypothetical protein